MIKNLLCALKEAPDVGNAAPEWFMIFPAGDIFIVGEDAPVIMDAEGAARIIEQFKAHQADMVIDYEHATLWADTAPAAGWIKELQWRDDSGLWARVEWTEAAVKYIESREYRYFSPVFFVNEDSRIVELYNVALTNQPAMQNITALAAKHNISKNQNRREFMLKKLKELLGLADTASEDEAFQKIEEVVAKNKELKEAIAAKPKEIIACKEILDSVGVDENASREDVLNAIDGLKAPADAAEKLSQQVAKLTADIAAMKQEDLVELALKDGKTTKAELDEWGRDLALKSPEQFEKIVLSRPRGSVVPVDNLPPGGGGPGGQALDDIVLTVAKMFGNTEDDLKKYGGIQ